jgi:hypothetical protein
LYHSGAAKNQADASEFSSFCKDHSGTPASPDGGATQYERAVAELSRLGDENARLRAVCRTAHAALRAALCLRMGPELSRRLLGILAPAVRLLAPFAPPASAALAPQAACPSCGAQTIYDSAYVGGRGHVGVRRCAVCGALRPEEARPQD